MTGVNGQQSIVGNGVRSNRNQIARADSVVLQRSETDSVYSGMLALTDTLHCC